MVQPNRTPEFRITPQLVLGVIVAAIGTLFTLDNLGVLEARDVFRYWPLALMIFGVAQVMSARTSARGFTGVLWILVGAVLLGRQLGLFRVGMGDLWPLILVALGGFIVWQAFQRQLPAPKTRGDVWSAGIDVERPAPTVTPPIPPRTASSGSTIAGFAFMGEFKRKINLGDFRGGHLTAFMGGCNVDLRGATPINGEAIIDVFALMGGIEIKVPNTWDVVNEVFPFMGGIEDKTTRPTGGSPPRLILRGFVMMGGVTIQN